MESQRVRHDWSNWSTHTCSMYQGRCITEGFLCDQWELSACPRFRIIVQDCVDHSQLWKIPDHLICLLRNLYAGQEATIRTGHGPTDWFQIGKGVCQGCILSPYLFNLYAEYIMQNAGLDKAQSGIKIVGRNINNLRYATDTTLMAESKEELKTSWWKWKRRVKKLA